MRLSLLEKVFHFFKSCFARGAGNCGPADLQDLLEASGNAMCVPVVGSVLQQIFVHLSTCSWRPLAPQRWPRSTSQDKAQQLKVLQREIARLNSQTLRLQ